MPFQKQINKTLALGVPGSYYDTTPRRATSYVAVANGAVLPAFGCVATKSAEGVAKVGGTGAFLGVFADPKSTPLIGGLEPSLSIKSGTEVGVCYFGHIVVKTAAAVTADSSLPIYNTTTGEISAVAAGTASAGEGYAFIPNARFAFVDADKTQDLLECLRNYQRKYDANKMIFSKEPLHNWASHGADAFRYMAQGYSRYLAKPVPQQITRPEGITFNEVRRNCRRITSIEHY